MKTKEEILIWALNNRCKYESSKEMDYDTHLAIMDAMEAYHEAKMKEVTDKDIQKYAAFAVQTSKGKLSPLIETGIIWGAKAMRDGKIKHSK